MSEPSPPGPPRAEGSTTVEATAADAPAAGRSPLRVALPLLAILTAVLIQSQFYRTAIAVIAPNLMRDPGLDAGELGFLSAAFFLASAAMQLPVGVLLDRYGPRWVVPLLMTVAVLGALLFSLAGGAAAIVVAQLLIGLGFSGVFMGTLVIVGRLVPADRFATVAAVLVAASNAGILASGTPFAFAVEAIGWRGSYLGLAAVTGALGFAVFALGRGGERRGAAVTLYREPLAETLRGLGQILRHREMHGLIAIAFVSYGAVMSVRGLWSGPYLADIHGLGTVARGNVLLIISIGTIAGALTYGPLDRLLNTRKRLVLGGSLTNAGLFALLAALSGPSLVLVAVLLTVMCAAGTFYVVVLAHARAFFSLAMAGRVMTTLNFATFLGVAMMQAVTGTIVRTMSPADGPAPEAAYRAVFAFLGAMVLTAAVIYAARTRDAPPRPAAEHGEG